MSLLIMDYYLIGFISHYYDKFLWWKRGKTQARNPICELAIYTAVYASITETFSKLSYLIAIDYHIILGLFINQESIQVGSINNRLGKL